MPANADSAEDTRQGASGGDEGERGMDEVRRGLVPRLMSDTVSNNLVSLCIALYRQSVDRRKVLDRMHTVRKSEILGGPRQGEGISHSQSFRFYTNPIIQSQSSTNSRFVFWLRSRLCLHLRMGLFEPRSNVRPILDVVPERVGQYLRGLTAEVVSDFVALD